MTDRLRQLHGSVFVRLVAIMVGMAMCLMVLVSALWMYLSPSSHESIDRDRFHIGILVLLLGVIVAVSLIVHGFLRKLLSPLRILSDGVARLADGDLDVQLPRSTSDEFGRLTDAFNHMAGRVRAMVGGRDQLLIDVSHELRSPLTRMKVTLEFLPADAQRARLAGDVTEMERMVTELLELERLRMGRGISTARQDLMPILTDVAATLHESHPGVRVVSTSHDLFVDVDGEKIRTVVRNLLGNAIKYSLPDSRPVEVSVVERAAAIEMRIADDGVGIPAEDAERIFEPFFRVDRSRSKVTGGYGLGLSICKRIMEAHGGSIVLERSASRGATFVLSFPRPSDTVD